MHMKSLKTAILLADLRSFRGVAEQLNVTQAAVSSRINALEQELGVKLFDRDSRGVALTRDGTTFIDSGRTLLANFESLMRDLTGQRSVTGIVKIGFISSMAETLLPILVSELRRRFDHVRFVIHCDINSNLQRLLASGDLDFALVTIDKCFDGFDQVPLCTFGSRWVASPAFLTEHMITGPVDAATLATFPIIAYETGTSGYERLSSVFSASELEQTAIHTSNSLPTSISMACAGIGMASVPPVVIQRELQLGTLRVIDSKRYLPQLQFVAAIGSKSTSPLSALVAQMAQEAAIQFCQNFGDGIAMAYPLDRS